MKLQQIMKSVQFAKQMYACHWQNMLLEQCANKQTSPSLFLRTATYCLLKLPGCFSPKAGSQKVGFPKDGSLALGSRSPR